MPVAAKTTTSNRTRTSSRPLKKNRKPHRLTRQKAYYTIFLLVWAAFSIFLSQYVIYPMAWLLGAKVNEPFWTLIYYITYNGLALVLILFVPPKLLQLYRRSHTPDGKLKPIARTSSEKSTAHTKSDSKTSTAVAITPVTTQTDQLFETNPEELGVSNWPTFVDIGLAPIAYVAYAVAANLIINIMSSFSWFDPRQEQNVGFGYYLTTSDRIFAMLAIVFIAPVVEELIFRGWLYGKLRNQFKIPLAILLTSMLFALLHGQLNVAISTFILSIALCGLREITGTIWSSMLLHILTNGIAFYALYVAI